MSGPHASQGPSKQKRRLISANVGITWQDKGGLQHFASVRALDLSDDSLRVTSVEHLDVGSYVQVHVEDLGFSRTALVAQCEQHGLKYVITLEFRKHSSQSNQETVEEEFADYYDLLQISSSAEAETVHRVYRLLAGRYHPDNTQTGDIHRFLLLQKAFEILSDPTRRAAYDAEYRARQTGPMPVFELKDFVVGIDAEKNRRIGVLCLLYNRRRSTPDKPSLSLLEFEQLMTIPREHLTFTVWYLKEKQMVKTEGGADFQITAEGVEFVESTLPSNRLLQRLLKAPADAFEDRPVPREADPARTT